MDNFKKGTITLNNNIKLKIKELKSSHYCGECKQKELKLFSITGPLTVKVICQRCLINYLITKVMN